MRASIYTCSFFLCLMASLVLLGCDSNDDSDDELSPDAELLVGDWTVTSAADQGGERDQTSVFASLGILSLALNEDNTFTLLLQYTDPDTDDLNLQGTYEVRDADDRLDLTLVVDTIGEIEISFSYSIIDESNVELRSSDSALFSLLLGIDFEGDIILTLQKVAGIVTI